MNARTLTVAWLITLALTLSGLFWLPQASGGSKAKNLSSNDMKVCRALDDSWTCN